MLACIGGKSRMTKSSGMYFSYYSCLQYVCATSIFEISAVAFTICPKMGENSYVFLFIAYETAHSNLPNLYHFPLPPWKHLANIIKMFEKKLDVPLKPQAYIDSVCRMSAFNIDHQIVIN